MSLCLQYRARNDNDNVERERLRYNDWRLGYLSCHHTPRRESPEQGNTKSRILLQANALPQAYPHRSASAAFVRQSPHGYV